MKRMFWMLMIVAFATACGEGLTDAPKDAATTPEVLDSNGKGDWRTRHYTDTRGEVFLDDTTFDGYAPIYPNYYNGYELALSEGDIVDVRVGAVSFGFDSVIGVYGPQRPAGTWGGLLQANDDTPEGNSLDSYLTFTAPKDGNYLILVREYSWNAGDIYVSATCEGGPCAEQQCGEVTCALYCENGFERDENGCEMCTCAPDPVCPFVQPPANVRCAGVVTWARDPNGSECCEYPSPCNVPSGWDTYGDEAACQVGVPGAEGEACSLYGRQCADGLECAFTCPDGSNDPNCNLGFNPHGTCEAPSVCNEGDTQLADDGCNTCTCSNGEWACTERACIAECTTDADCVVTGCSGQVCAPEHRATTCEWREEYACYREPTTSCGCVNGSCGWDQTAALDSCLDD